MMFKKKRSVWLRDITPEYVDEQLKIHWEALLAISRYLGMELEYRERFALVPRKKEKK
jgi:hypothetical protein